MSKTYRNPGSGSREGLMHEEDKYGNGPQDDRGSKKGRGWKTKKLRIALARKLKEKQMEI